jgi:hypothetical protein
VFSSSRDGTAVCRLRASGASRGAISKKLSDIVLSASATAPTFVLKSWRALRRLQRVNLDKTQDEHNESALPPKLTVAADIRDRQFSAGSRLGARTKNIAASQGPRTSVMRTVKRRRRKVICLSFFGAHFVCGATATSNAAITNNGTRFIPRSSIIRMFSDARPHNSGTAPHRDHPCPDMTLLGLAAYCWWKDIRSSRCMFDTQRLLRWHAVSTLPTIAQHY